MNIKINFVLQPANDWLWLWIALESMRLCMVPPIYMVLYLHRLESIFMSEKYFMPEIHFSLLIFCWKKYLFEFVHKNDFNRNNQGIHVQGGAQSVCLWHSLLPGELENLWVNVLFHLIDSRDVCLQVSRRLVWPTGMNALVTKCIRLCHMFC